MMRQALVVLNGHFQDYMVLKRGLNRVFKDIEPEVILGVDGGAAHLKALQLSPTHILGDFDSIEDCESLKGHYPDSEWLVYPKEKDYTDSELALETIAEMGCDRVVVVGAFGGRLDHMIGTLFLLNRYHRLFEMILIDEQNQVTLLEGPIKQLIHRSEVPHKYVSFIPISDDAKGINLKGFKYPLVNAQVQMGETIGISNEIEEKSAEITFDSGKLLMVFSDDKFL